MQRVKGLGHPVAVVRVWLLVNKQLTLTKKVLGTQMTSWRLEVVRVSGLMGLRADLPLRGLIQKKRKSTGSVPSSKKAIRERDIDECIAFVKGNIPASTSTELPGTAVFQRMLTVLENMEEVKQHGMSLIVTIMEKIRTSTNAA